MAEPITAVVARLHNALSNLRDGEEAQSLVEYALIIAIIALGLVVALFFLRGEIADLFSDTASELDNPAP